MSKKCPKCKDWKNQCFTIATRYAELDNHIKALEDNHNKLNDFLTEKGFTPEMTSHNGVCIREDAIDGAIRIISESLEVQNEI